MEDLIKALTILKKYLKDRYDKYPTLCEHDILYVCGIDLPKIPVEEVRLLDELGFIPGLDNGDYNFIEETLGYDFAITGNFKEITSEQWDMIKNSLSDCFHSFRFGSC